MKISLNQELSVLTEARDRGELSASEYRLQRRNILERLSSVSTPQVRERNPMAKSVLVGTLVIVSLLLMTVFLVKAFM